jgi:hypothetical protein
LARGSRLVGFEAASWQGAQGGLLQATGEGLSRHLREIVLPPARAALGHSPT